METGRGLVDGVQLKVFDVPVSVRHPEHLVEVHQLRW